MKSLQETTEKIISISVEHRDSLITLEALISKEIAEYATGLVQWNLDKKTEVNETQ